MPALLDLLQSPDGWHTRSINDPCILHETGWHVLCHPDGCDDGPAQVAIFPPDGSHLTYQPPLAGGFFGLLACRADRSDPVVKAFLTVQERCRDVRLAQTLDSARQKRYEEAVENVRLRAALTTIRTAGNDSPQTVWMQEVAAHALEPDKWPEAGKLPLAP